MLLYMLLILLYIQENLHASPENAQIFHKTCKCKGLMSYSIHSVHSGKCAKLLKTCKCKGLKLYAINISSIHSGNR